MPMGTTWAPVATSKPARPWGNPENPQLWIGDSLGMDSLANGKKVLALNLKSPKGREIIHKLCKVSDVLIEPFRPGLLSLLGRKESKPTVPLNLVADFGGGGLLCAFGILIALLERTTSGRGQVIDANMVEGSAYLGSWIFRTQKLPIWGQPRGNNMLDTGAHFYDTYKTKDGEYMAVGAIEPQFYSALLKGLGLPEDTPRWKESEEAETVFAETFSQKTQDEWCKIFDGTDACVSPVLTMSKVAEHPHNASRQSFTKCKDGSVAPTVAPSLSRSPGISLASLPLPQQAQDTVEILRSLSYQDQEIEQLEKEGVIETLTPSSKY